MTVKFKADDLSDSQVRDMIAAAVCAVGPETYSCYLVDVNRAKGYCTYQRYSGDDAGLYKCTFEIGDDYACKLGAATKVVVTQKYEKAAFSLGATADAVVENGYRLYRNSLLFRAGEYRDKNFAMTPAEIATAASGFSGTAPVNLEHAPAMLVGKLGEVRGLHVDPADGETLRGVVAIPTWLDDQLTDEERHVSAEFDRTTKKLVGLALTNTPRVEGAALMAAFSAANPTSTTDGSGHPTTAAGKSGKEKRPMPSAREVFKQAAALFTRAAADPAIEEDPNDTRTETDSDADKAAAAKALADAKAAATFADTERAKMSARLADLEARDVERSAAAFADSVIADKRALTSERDTLIVQFTRAALDDTASPATVKFSVVTDKGVEERTGSRVALLQAQMAIRPRHMLFDEMIASGEKGEKVVVSFADDSDKSGKDDDEEVAKHLQKTPLGKKAAAKKKEDDK